MPAKRRSRRRGGFSLAEVIIALTVLSVAMMLLARLSYLVSQSGRTNDLVAKRNAALAQEAGRFGVMGFTDIAKQSSGSTLMLVGDFTFTRRLTITATKSNWYTIKVVVAPQASEFRADSVTFSRTRPGTGTTLCITC
ncbi:MAG: prepilin-type N-terminal cleavage/methylation domain-containing protein [Gemmatimonadota bacterium]